MLSGQVRVVEGVDASKGQLCLWNPLWRKWHGCDARLMAGQWRVFGHAICFGCYVCSLLMLTLLIRLSHIGVCSRCLSTGLALEWCRRMLLANGVVKVPVICLGPVSSVGEACSGTGGERRRTEANGGEHVPVRCR